jgi:tetratricopeptide (TPR) repeat protein
MSNKPLIIRTLGPLTLEGLKLDLPSLQALAYVVRQQEEHQPVTVEQVAELIWENSANPLASFKVSRSNVNKQTQKAFQFNAYVRPDKGVLKVVNIISDVKLLEEACAAKEETDVRMLCKGLFFENTDVTDTLGEWRDNQQRQIRRMVWNTYLGLATSHRDKAIAYVQTAFELMKNELPDDERKPYRVSTLKRLYHLLQTVENAEEKLPEQLLENLVPDPEWNIAAEEVEIYLQLWQTEVAHSESDKLEQRLRAVLKESHLDKFEQMALIAQDLYRQHEQSLHFLNSSDRLLIYYALQAAQHPLAQQISGKLRLSQASSDQARLRLVTALLFLDRKRIQKTLNALIELRAGKWAWVYGKPGTGKSLLLEQLPGFKLDGKTEPPYETLNPLLEKDVSELGDFKNTSKESIGKFLLERLLEKLSSSNIKTLLIDNWENVDTESYRVFEALNKSSNAITVIITSTNKTPPKALQNVQFLELGNLNREDIDKDITELFEQTGGIPHLVAANLKDESISDALKTVLKNLSEEARDFYFAQALLHVPNHELLCNALSISEGKSYEIQNELIGFGLMLGNGDINPREVARNYLMSETPRDFARLSFALAKVLPGVEALPYFRNAKVLWRTKDYGIIEKAHLEYVGDLLDRESPQRLLELLRELENHFSLLSQVRHPDLTYVKAQLFLQMGDSFKALELISTLEETPKVLALKAEVFYRADNLVEAEACGQRATSSLDNLAKASSLNTLGKVLFHREQFDKALPYFEQSSRLWKTLGQRVKYARSLMNQANARSELARLSKTIDGTVLNLYDQVLHASQNNPLLSPQVFQNQGIHYHLRGKLTKNRDDFAASEGLLKKGLEGARAMFLKVSVAEIHCNLAELYTDQVRLFGFSKSLAEDAIERALNLSTEIADDGLIARVTFFQQLLSDSPNRIKLMERAIETLRQIEREAEAHELCEYLPEDNVMRLSLEREKKKRG